MDHVHDLRRPRPRRRHHRPLRDVTTTTYDIRGNVIETRSEAERADGTPTFLVTRTVYDANGRATFATDPFDVNDAATDVRGTQTVYDPLGRVKETLRIEHLHVQLVADPNNPGQQVSEVTNAGSLVTLWSTKTRYDDAGRVYEAESETGLVTRYAYDANDRLLTEVKTVPADSARDRNTRYAYDGTTQISKTVKTGTVLDSGTDVEVVTQTFNAMGRMDAVTVVKDGNTTETLYEYNDRGLRTKATETVNGDSVNAKATLYHFDPAGRNAACCVADPTPDTHDAR